MEDYQELAIVGQGSYGIVYKCKHKITGEIVAVKQLLDEANEQVRKTAIREATILRHLQHPNVVRLLEVFRSKTRIYMVFEYMDRTILRLLERHPRGMPAADVKKILWQLVLALNLLHSQSIIHRDLKPENVLIDEKGVVKLCDFGFARPQTAGGINLSPYVATRWYRAPELLVGDVYGPGVDVWALGCLLVELATGQPLFPGKTNVDQLWLIMKCTGCTKRQISRMHTNTQMAGLRLPTELELIPLQKRFSKFDSASMSLLLACLAPDPHDRPSVASLMDHEYFTLTKQQLATHTAAALKASSVSVAAAAALTSHASTAVVPLSADLRHPPQQQYKLHIHGPPMPQPMPQQLGPLLPGTVSRGVPPPHAGQGPGQHGQQQDYIQQHGPGQGQQGPLLPGTAPWHGQGQQRQLGRGPGQQGPEQGQQGHGHGQGPLLPGTAPRLANQTQQPGQQGQGQQGRLLPQGQRSQAARSVVYDPRPVAYDPRPVASEGGSGSGAAGRGGGDLDAAPAEGEAGLTARGRARILAWLETVPNAVKAQASKAAQTSKGMFKTVLSMLPKGARPAPAANGLSDRDTGGGSRKQSHAQQSSLREGVLETRFPSSLGGVSGGGGAHGSVCSASWPLAFAASSPQPVSAALAAKLLQGGLTCEPLPVTSLLASTLGGWSSSRTPSYTASQISPSGALSVRGMPQGPSGLACRRASINLGTGAAPLACPFAPQPVTSATAGTGLVSRGPISSSETTVTTASPRMTGLTGAPGVALPHADSPRTPSRASSPVLSGTSVMGDDWYQKLQVAIAGDGAILPWPHRTSSVHAGPVSLPNPLRAQHSDSPHGALAGRVSADWTNGDRPSPLFERLSHTLTTHASNPKFSSDALCPSANHPFGGSREAEVGPGRRDLLGHGHSKRMSPICSNANAFDPSPGAEDGGERHGPASWLADAPTRAGFPSPAVEFSGAAHADHASRLQVGGQVPLLDPTDPGSVNRTSNGSAKMQQHSKQLSIQVTDLRPLVPTIRSNGTSVSLPPLPSPPASSSASQALHTPLVQTLIYSQAVFDQLPSAFGVPQSSSKSVAKPASITSLTVSSEGPVGSGALAQLTALLASEGPRGSRDAAVAALSRTRTARTIQAAPLHQTSVPVHPPPEVLVDTFKPPGPRLPASTSANPPPSHSTLGLSAIQQLIAQRGLPNAGLPGSIEAALSGRNSVTAHSPVDGSATIVSSFPLSQLEPLAMGQSVHGALGGDSGVGAEANYKTMIAQLTKGVH